MNMPDIRPVESETRLKVSYRFDPAKKPESDRIATNLHGLSHTSNLFSNHINALNREGVHAASIDMVSGGNNWISFDEYLLAHHEALTQIQHDTGMQIGSILGHSMGGMIVQETMQEYPEWRKPAVFVAPIPMAGAMPGMGRAVWKHPSTLPKSMKNFDITNVMKTPAEVRTLFFDKDTPEGIVRETLRELRETSYRAYLTLLTRPLTRPRMERRDKPALLEYCENDYLFWPGMYRNLEKAYPRLQRKKHERGGHDFFIEFGDVTGYDHATFHKQHNAA